MVSLSRWNCVALERVLEWREPPFGEDISEENIVKDKKKKALGDIIQLLYLWIFQANESLYLHYC